MYCLLKHTILQSILVSLLYLGFAHNSIDIFHSLNYPKIIDESYNELVLKSASGKPCNFTQKPQYNNSFILDRTQSKCVPGIPRLYFVITIKR